MLFRIYFKQQGNSFKMKYSVPTFCGKIIITFNKTYLTHFIWSSNIFKLLLADHLALPGAA